MAHELLLPQWSMGMHEGKILKWLKQPGDLVNEGEIIAEVESSKVVSELHADRDGVLLQLLVEEEQEVPVRTPLCLIGEQGEAPGADQYQHSSELPAVSAESLSSRSGAAGSVAPVRVQVTPQARRLAKQQGINLSRLTGSGPNGRIVADDVQVLVSRAQQSGESYPLTGLRATIASNMTRSLQQSAQLTLTSEVDVSVLVERRKTLSVGYSDLIAYALSRVLPNHPRLNAWISSDGGTERVTQIAQVNLGFAVALNDGLVVPVIRAADTLSLNELATQSASLTSQAREGQLPPEAFAGGSFTISNLGAYGVDAFTPIINPPQVAILGIGRVRERPVRDGDQLGWQHNCVLSLTFDHRVTDGAPAALLLRDIAAFVGDPGQFE